MEKEKAEIASLVEKYGRVQSLMKYVNSDTLKESTESSRKGKAVGTDGITKEEYGENLEGNIENLLIRMKKFHISPIQCAEPIYPKGMERCAVSAYRHLKTKSCRVSSRRYWKAIYEPKFKEFSFGFRPN